MRKNFRFNRPLFSKEDDAFEDVDEDIELNQDNLINIKENKNKNKSISNKKVDP